MFCSASSVVILASAPGIFFNVTLSSDTLCPLYLIAKDREIPIYT